MKIGIVYDTAATYNLQMDNEFICDLCDEECIEHIANTLISHGHSVDKINGIKMLNNKIHNDYDIILNTYEGIVSRNREAVIPAILEAAKLNYVGADSYIGAITLDKQLLSRIVSSIGIKCPQEVIIDTKDKIEVLNDPRLKQMTFPIIIKPNLGGNSSGVFVCQNFLEMRDHMAQIADALPNESIICQEFIRGVEITVPIFGNDDNIEIFDIIGFKEQQNNNFWINTEQKVFGGVTETKIELNPIVETELLSICRKIYSYFHFRDYTRLDFRIRDNDIFFLEANAFPYLGEDGAMFESYKRNKHSYYEFLMYLLDIAFKRENYSINKKSHK